MPLVPGAPGVVVNDASGDGEGTVLVNAGGAELNGRAIGRQVRHHTHALQVDIFANQDRPAMGAGGLHAAGPLKYYRRAAARAKRGGPAHAPTFAGR